MYDLYRVKHTELPRHFFFSCICYIHKSKQGGATWQETSHEALLTLDVGDGGGPGEHSEQELIPAA